jgi:hypothetical protein
MHVEMLDLLEALRAMMCGGLDGHQRGCEGGRLVGGLRYAQACDCAWTFRDEGSASTITGYTNSPEGRRVGGQIRIRPGASYPEFSSDV